MKDWRWFYVLYQAAPGRVAGRPWIYSERIKPHVAPAIVLE
jgi:hypothetical protein